MNKLLAISIASASIAIGAIPALAEVDSKIHALCLNAKDYSGCVKTQTSLSDRTKAAPVDSTESEPSESTAWQKHLNENPNLKAWVEANPSLGEARKKKWLSENEFASEKDCPEGCYFSPSAKECSFWASSNQELTPCSRISKEKAYKARQKQVQLSSCPPGKRQYQKTALFGLIKGAKLCLTDYEAESLRQVQIQRALQNFSNSISQPQVVNFYSNTYGNYTSTSCY